MHKSYSFNLLVCVYFHITTDIYIIHLAGGFYPKGFIIDEKHVFYLVANNMCSTKVQN